MMVGKQGSRHDESGLKESVSPIVAQSVFYFYLFIYLGFKAQLLKVCRTPGPTAY